MEALNNFFLSLSTISVGPGAVFLSLSIVLLIVFLVLAFFDAPADLGAGVLLLQLIFNLVFCLAYLPSHYVFFTKLVVFFIPYILVVIAVLYIDVLQRRKGD